MPRKERVVKYPTSVRLTPEALRLLQALAAKSGISQAAWMESIIRREAKREKME